MEVRTVILLLLLLLLLGQSVVDAQIECQSDDDIDCDGTEAEEFSNGYENFLPVEPGEPYRIRLRKFDYLIGVNPECILGNANNYLPWLFPNGSLAIRSSSQALDVSNLKLNDNAMESVVEKLESMLNFSVSDSKDNSLNVECCVTPDRDNLLRRNVRAWSTS